MSPQPPSAGGTRDSRRIPHLAWPPSQAGARGVTAAAAAAALACSALALVGAAGGGQAASRRHRLPLGRLQRPAATRAAAVLAKMTLDDKLAMVDGTGFSTGAAGYVGHIAANPRLCIPGLNLEDGPQGVADGVTGVTQLPAPVALAAAFDPALARSTGPWSAARNAPRART